MRERQAAAVVALLFIATGIYGLPAYAAEPTGSTAGRIVDISTAGRVIDFSPSGKTIDFSPAGTVVDMSASIQAVDGRVVDSLTSTSQTLTLNADVLFAFNSSDLTPEAQTLIAGVSQSLKGARGVLAIDGYTDSLGDPSQNRTLSTQRAQAVRDALRPLTAPTTTYTVAGHGADRPVAPNTTPAGADNPEGRAKNRRVTITSATAGSDFSTPLQTSQLPPSVSASKEIPGRDGQAVRLNIRPLRRSGSLMIMSYSIANTGSTSVIGSSSISASGIHLLDRQRMQTYAPASDALGHAMTEEPGLIPPGASADGWAYFAAAAPDVTSLDLIFTDVATFPATPVS